MPWACSLKVSTEGCTPNTSSLYEKYRYQHRYRTVLPFDNGRNPSDGTGAAGRTGSRRTGLRKDAGRPRTDIVKLRDDKVFYDNSGKTADEACKGRWRRQPHFHLPRSTERSGVSIPHGQLD